MNSRRIDNGDTPSLATRERVIPRDITRAIVDNQWVVLGIAAAITLFAGAYAALATPMFAADALVQIEVPKQDTLADVLSRQQSDDAPLLDGPPTNTEIAIIRSRKVLVPVISRYKLNIVAKPRRILVLGRITAGLTVKGRLSRAWPGLSSYAWGGERLDIGQLNVPVVLQDKKLQLDVLENQRYRLLDNSGKLLVLGVEGRLAHAGNVTILIDRMVARPGESFTVEQLRESTALKGFQKQLKVVEVVKETGVVQITFENSDPSLATEVANSITQNYIDVRLTRDREEASKVLDVINGELPGMRDNLKRAEDDLKAHRLATGSMQTTSESQSYLQGSIELFRQIAELELKRTMLLDRFAPKSPEVKTLDIELAELREAKHRFDTRFNSMPVVDREAVDLQRNVKVAEDIYVAMLNKANELTVSLAGNVGNVRIVDMAIKSTAPVRPRRALIVTLAFVLGLILGPMCVIVRRGLSKSISEPEQIEKRFQLQVLGVVPDFRRIAPTASSERNNFDRLKTSELIAASYPDDFAVEALRRLRTMLSSRLLGTQRRVMLVTSATPVTGKSFIAANVASLYAQAGKRVLLIDADLRSGGLSAFFGMTGKEGLAELLTDDIPIERVIQSTDVPGLSLLPVGVRRIDPTEHLARKTMPELVDRFAATFDLVFFDTPPILAVSDALIIARYVGVTVLVVRENAQSEFELEEALTQMECAGIQIDGAIFNCRSLRGRDRRRYDYMHLYAEA